MQEFRELSRKLLTLSSSKPVSISGGTTPNVSEVGGGARCATGKHPWEWKAHGRRTCAKSRRMVRHGAGKLAARATALVWLWTNLQLPLSSRHGAVPPPRWRTQR